MLVSTFSPPIRVGPGIKLSVKVQSSLRLPVFDSIGLVLDIKADLKLSMTSGIWKKQDGGQGRPRGNRSADLGAAEVSPLDPFAARVLAWLSLKSFLNRVTWCRKINHLSLELTWSIPVCVHNSRGRCLIIRCGQKEIIR